MPGLTIEEKNQVEHGAAHFSQELRSALPDIFEAPQPGTLSPAVKSDAFLEAYSTTVGQLATSKFSASLQSLLETDADADGGALLAADGGKSIGYFIMRAFQKRLCNPQSEADLKAEIDKAKADHGMDIDPSASHITVGAGTAVAVAVVTAMGTGPLAVVLAPLAGSVACLLLLVGVDTFCGWAAAKD